MYYALCKLGGRKWDLFDRLVRGAVANIEELAVLNSYRVLGKSVRLNN